MYDEIRKSHMIHKSKGCINSFTYHPPGETTNC